jgi:hypothetical protein
VVAIVSSLVRAMFKLVIFALFAAGILIFGFNYSTDEVKDLGLKALSAVSQVFKEVTPVVQKEISQADVVFHQDGSYEMKTKSLRIIGVKGKDEATLVYKGHSYKIDVSDFGNLINDKLKEAEKKKQTH